MFKKFLIESKKRKYLEIPDPTNLGLKIIAKILIVPGKDGKGAYKGDLDINTPNNVGGAILSTKLQHSLEAAQTALKELLKGPIEISVTKNLLDKNVGKNDYTMKKVEIPGLRYIGTHYLEPVLTYGSGWDEEALKRRPEYDPQKHAKRLGLTQQLTGIIGDFKKEQQQAAKERRKFGDGPPEYSQFLNSDSIHMIPDMVKTFGDFELVIKWDQKPRQIIWASDFYKNYDKIVKNSEVISGDYIREVWVHKRNADV